MTNLIEVQVAKTEVEVFFNIEAVGSIKVDAFTLEQAEQIAAALVDPAVLQQALLTIICGATGTVTPVSVESLEVTDIEATWG